MSRFDTLFPSELHTNKDDNINKEEENDSSNYYPQTSIEMGSKFVLNQFEPAYNIQVYLKFANMEAHIYNSRFPYFQATGDLPQLNDGNFLVPNKDIINHLKSYHLDLDMILTEKEKAISKAFESLISNDLDKCLEYCTWMDPIIYKDITLPLYKKIIYFPLKSYITSCIHSSKIQNLNYEGMNSKDKIFMIARDGYAAINEMIIKSNKSKNLKNNVIYVFGKEKPSVIDAMLFGHLIYALNNNLVKDIIISYAPELVDYTKNIIDKYFSDKNNKLFTTNKISLFDSMNYLEIAKDSLPSLTYLSSSNHILYENYIPYKNIGSIKRNDIVVENKIKNQYESQNEKESKTQSVNNYNYNKNEDRKKEKEIENRGKQVLFFSGFMTLFYMLNSIFIKIENVEGMNDTNDMDYSNFQE